MLTSSFSIQMSKNGCITGETSQEWVKVDFDGHEVANCQCHLLIFDGHVPHFTPDFLEYSNSPLNEHPPVTEQWALAASYMAH